MLKKMCCGSIKPTIITRSYSDKNETLPQILTHYFGFHHATAHSYVEENKLYNHRVEHVKRNIEYCSKVGFKTKEILANPSLLRAKPITLEHHYNVMVEGGFDAITAKILLKFTALSKKQIKILKRMGFIKSTTNVSEHFIGFLNRVPHNFHIEHRGDEEIWFELHNKILNKYLQLKLDVTKSEIDRLFGYYPSLKRKSLRFICENLKMSAELGFDSEAILRYGYLLTHHPNHTKTVLETYPDLAGADMRKAMRMFPKLTTIPPEHFKEVYEVLKRHNITDEMIRGKMNVFQLAADTVNFRIDELKRVADLKVLLKNPRILQLVVHHNRAKSRLDFMKQLQLKCTGLVVLGTDDDRFAVHIREGRDVNATADLFKFIKEIFNKDPSDFQMKLKKHPFYLQVPLVLMQETYNYLKSNDFTQKSIYDTICVLLYPKQKIITALEQVQSYQNERDVDLTQVEILNLALYFMEKEYHFTGNGIWIDSDTVCEEINKMNN